MGCVWFLCRISVGCSCLGDPPHARLHPVCIVHVCPALGATGTHGGTPAWCLIVREPRRILLSADTLPKSCSSSGLCSFCLGQEYFSSAQNQEMLCLGEEG